jgi:tetratricopeptide (TPR) repeat protein
VAEILIDMSSFSTDAAAGAMLRRAREIAESAYPGATIHGRALLYSAFNNIYRGELEQARRFLEQAIEIQEAHDQTTGLVESLSTLGSVYDYAGATEQSIAMLERAVQLAIDLRGDTHPWTAGILNNLAVTHHRQGNLDQALPYYQRALNIAESSLGPRSGLRRTTLTNLGELERDRGAYEQSEKYLGLAAQLQREIDGQIEAYLTGQIALLRLAQGRHNEALELFDSYFGKDGMPSLDPEHTPILEGYARLRHELGQNQ